MSQSTLVDSFELLEEGNVVDYVDRQLFAGKIDSLRTHIQRKKALAEQFRYSVLYLLYEYGEISRSRLATRTGRESNQLHHHLEELLDANLIARIPAPESADGRRTYYRITTLGKQEIESDIEHIVGGFAHEDWYKIRGDPELVDGIRERRDLRTQFVMVDGPEPDILDERRSDLRGKHRDFERVTDQV